MWKIMKPWIDDAFKQLFERTGKRSGKLQLSHLAFTRMQEHGLSEQDIENAFRFGTQTDEKTIVQRFRAYTIGMWFKEAEKPDEYVIITCWRGERR